MQEIEQRVLAAQQSNLELEQLLQDYQPFLKKQLATLTNLGFEMDDLYSLAMLTFVNCVRQYTTGRGSFLAFCSVSIRNRIIDEKRRMQRQTLHTIPLSAEAEQQLAPEDLAALSAYNREQERLALCEEIDRFSAALHDFQITFQELSRICPRQKRSRQQCVGLARALVQNESWRKQLLQQHQLPQQALAQTFDLSVKTIEKHRKYIITLTLLLLGDYPGIRAFLPQYQEVQS